MGVSALSEFMFALAYFLCINLIPSLWVKITELFYRKYHKTRSNFSFARSCFNPSHDLTFSRHATLCSLVVSVDPPLPPFPPDTARLDLPATPAGPRRSPRVAAAEGGADVGLGWLLVQGQAREGSAPEPGKGEIFRCLSCYIQQRQNMSFRLLGDFVLFGL